METTLQRDPVTGEQVHNLAAAAKCLHGGCSCTVTSGEQYCSDYCARAAESGEPEQSKGEHDCGCGHLECAHAVAIAPIPPAILPQMS
jgi:hypothetical protein